MSNLPAIREQLKSDATNNLLVRALGYSDVNDTRAVAEAKRYASSVLTTIDSDPKLQDLEPKSIVLSMIDAAKFKLEIDGRKLAYIVPYGGKATMQISYKGFAAKLKEHYPDMDYTVGMVYEKDVFNLKDNDGYQEYQHIANNPFMQQAEGLKGCFVCLKWTENGQKRQKVIIVPKADLDKMKAKSKGGNWGDWYSQMAIKSAFKRACKLHFASISTLSDMSNYDNETNVSAKSDAVFDSEKPSIIDNLNKEIIPQTVAPVIDAEEFVEEEIEQI
jgi:phage RecT family recombinase